MAAPVPEIMDGSSDAVSDVYVRTGLINVLYHMILLIFQRKYMGFYLGV
jgi:hypothetical protein